MAKMLLNSVEKCRVDIFDRNPHPYGLIRTGVAPDHQAMKNIQKDFKEVFEKNQGRCEFFGNVWVGKVDPSLPDYEVSKAHQQDGVISVEQLRQNYSAVVLAHGALRDRLLGLPHELDTLGIMPSRRVVNWYNGSLDNDLSMEDEFDLTRSKNMTVIGNGNIFCDMARILLKDPKDLEKTDVPDEVIKALKESRLENVQSIARKGITHAAFTTKEIRELASLEGVEYYMMRDEVQRSITDASTQEMNSTYARAVGRRTEFMLKQFRAIQNEEHYQEVLNNGKKKLILRFLLTPKEFQVDTEASRVQGMVF
mmetsp:Transcript_7059/g.11886  ORF Transcript_7059/g.11886 Transcript_7059/m.11886 type:complete len:310 (+) Transcript_7059:197-1126(+)